MSWTRAVGLLSVGICGGVLAWVLAQQFDQPRDAGANLESSSPVRSDSPDQTPALSSENDQRISTLSAENAALQAELASKSVENTPNRKPSALMAVREFRKREIIAAKQRDTENLLAAGYSMDRIEYLQRRAGELTAQFRQNQADQMKQGVRPLDTEKDLELAAALPLDPTFALKYELGDVEYERYLVALKRPTTVVVGDVKGGLASSIVIMPGDEIVDYNNKRVFNSGQLRAMSVARPTDIPGVLVPITVRRDGQVMLMTVSKGFLGVFDAPPAPPASLPIDLIRMNAN